MKINKKILTAVVVVVIVVIGLVLGHQKLWWFTPAYADRQEVQTLFHDASSGNDKKAYSLTTSVFQSRNSYAVFEADFDYYAGSKLTTNFSSYAKKTDGSMLLVGTVNDKTNKDVTTFEMGLVGGKISTVSILSQPVLSK